MKNKIIIYSFFLFKSAFIVTSNHDLQLSFHPDSLPASSGSSTPLAPLRRFHGGHISPSSIAGLSSAVSLLQGQPNDSVQKSEARNSSPVIARVNSSDLHFSKINASSNDSLRTPPLFSQVIAHSNVSQIIAHSPAEEIPDTNLEKIELLNSVISNEVVTTTRIIITPIHSFDKDSSSLPFTEYDQKVLEQDSCFYSSQD